MSTAKNKITPQQAKKLGWKQFKPQQPKSKKPAPKKRLNIQTRDAEIQKKLLAYRDQLAAGKDPVQEGAIFREKFQNLRDEKFAEMRDKSNGEAKEVKQKTVADKQNEITELLSASIKEVIDIHDELFKFFKGTDAPQGQLSSRSPRGIHQWLDGTIIGAITINQVQNAIHEMLNENL